MTFSCQQAAENHAVIDLSPPFRLYSMFYYNTVGIASKHNIIAVFSQIHAVY